MHTISLAVPIYRKKKDVYCLDRCVQVDNGCRSSLVGSSIKTMLCSLKQDVSTCVSILVLKGDKLVVSTCEGTQYTYDNDRTNITYACKEMIDDSQNSVVVSNETALCFVNKQQQVLTLGALFDHNTCFKRCVPACRMETYIQNVCKYQKHTIQRLLKNVRWYEYENEQSIKRKV